MFAPKGDANASPFCLILYMNKQNFQNLLQKGKICDRMIVPNQLNILTRVFLCLFTRDKYTFLQISYTFLCDEFDKMQIPLDTQKMFSFSCHIKLVWRLSEFAFLCGYFGSRTFCFIIHF